MSESKQPKFETVRQGCVRLTPSLEVLLARWARGCDENPFTTATEILKDNGYSFVSLVGENAGTYAENFECPHCGAKEAAERGAPPTPSCFLTGGSYRPGGQSNPRSVQCRACGRVTKPSALVEHLYPSKPARHAFLQEHCGGAKPVEQRWVAARHDCKAAVAADAESAMDHAAPDTFPPEMELCLLLGIEQPIDAADLELPYVAVPLSERGAVKALAWHGERPTMDEQARYHTWHRAAARERQKEIERRTRLVTAELAREVPLQ